MGLQGLGTLRLCFEQYEVFYRGVIIIGLGIILWCMMNQSICF